MSEYNLFSQSLSYFCRYSTHFIVFIPRPVTTSLDWFFAVFAVLACRSWILKLSGTRLVCGPSNRTKTGWTLKHYVLSCVIESVHSVKNDH